MRRFAAEWNRPQAFGKSGLLFLARRRVPNSYYFSMRIGKIRKHGLTVFIINLCHPAHTGYMPPDFADILSVNENSAQCLSKQPGIFHFIAFPVISDQYAKFRFVRSLKNGEKIMKIMVSACLLGQKCKYNGGDNFSEKVLAFTAGHEVIPVCPEVAGGLPVPRPSCEIVNGVVTDSEGISRDNEFRAGAKACLQLAKDKGIDLAILQSRSPSCGVNQVYDGTFSGRLIKGSGVFASMLRENGFTVMDAEDPEAAHPQ